MGHISEASHYDPVSAGSRDRALSRYVIGGLLALVLGTLLVARFRPAHEPSFQGRSVSDWFAQASDPTNYWWMQDAWLEAQLGPKQVAANFLGSMDAFIKMGPDSVPYLLERFESPRPESSPGYKRLYGESPLLLRRILPRPQNREQEHKTADLILRHLGPAACSGVPRLIRILGTEGSTQVEVINILRSIGSPASNAVPVLTPLLSGSDAYLQVAAADAIRKIAPTHTPSLLAVYRSALTNADPQLRTMAAGSLWEATGNSGDVVAPLIPLLNDRRCAVQACVVLKQCGPSASNAVPGLVALMEAPDLSLRVAGAITLNSVAPGLKRTRVEQLLSSGRAMQLELLGLAYPATDADSK